MKIGKLYRNDGQLGDQQLFPEGWVEASRTGRGESAYPDDPYGYGWFLQQQFHLI